MAVIDLVPPITTLTTESPCIQCLSPSQKEILRIWAMAQVLKFAGGTDYTDLATLNDATKCWKCEPDSTLVGFEAQAWIDAAVDLGLDLGGTPEEVTTQFNALFKCWRCLDPKATKANYTFLITKLIAQVGVVL